MKKRFPALVYEFNDFNEYGYISCLEDLPTLIHSDVINLLKEKFKTLNFLNNLKINSTERCDEQFHKKITSFLEEGKFEDLLKSENKCLRLLEENFAFSSVGIFCASILDVFSDDSAQLMFAHYAKNLSGVALIYEIEENSTIHEIQYTSKKGSSGIPTHCIN